MKNKSLEKLELLFTIVSHGRSKIFQDFLEENGANACFVIQGEGMHPKEFYKQLSYTKKDVIISFIGADNQKQIIRKLEDKFASTKYSYGSCWTVPLTSIIGVKAYQFLVDYRQKGAL